MELAPNVAQEKKMRVVTIKHPPAAILDGERPDKSTIGQIHDVPAPLALRLMAAGWVRSDTRSRVRRHRDESSQFNRRETADRRSTEG
jgi:hypothetical protein